MRLKDIVFTARSIGAEEALRRLHAAAVPYGDDLVREAYASEEFRRAVVAWGRTD